MSGTPFHRCTHTALSPQGDIYVSDGYGNARVHKFSPDGKLLKSWGEPGTDPGQFNIVHNIVTDAEGWVYVADRENHRVQVFDGNGKYETQWATCTGRARSTAAAARSRSSSIGELGPACRSTAAIRTSGRGCRSSTQGQAHRAPRRRDGPGLEPGKFIAPHGLAVDSRGDIYCGEVSYTEFPRLFPEQKIAWRMRSLQKLEKIS
jgi:DNA-binding beta-propeller fold protein YncE